MEDIMNMIVNNGVAIVIVAYFIYKDFTQSKEQIEATKEQTASNQKLIDKIDQLLQKIIGGSENEK